MAQLGLAFVLGGVSYGILDDGRVMAPRMFFNWVEEWIGRLGDQRSFSIPILSDSNTTPQSSYVQRSYLNQHGYKRYVVLRRLW
jgi:hypothetical protein